MTIPVPPVPPSNLFVNATYFYANNTYSLGSLSNPVDAVTQVTIDYTQLGITIESYTGFLVDKGGGPPLTITNPSLTANILTFFIAKGIPNLEYTVTIMVVDNLGQTRSDDLIVITPASNGYTFPSAFPVDISPANGSVAPIMIGGNLVFISSQPRWFVGSLVPEGPNIMDYWYNPISNSISIFATDGTNIWWQFLVNGTP